MTPTVTIRPAYPDDERALARLAALDSQRLPAAGPFLLAEIDGVLRAAIATTTGRTFSDPFVPTAELVELLRRRRTQLAAAQEARGLSRPRPSARLRGRAAEA
jgi:hypothetical protein